MEYWMFALLQIVVLFALVGVGSLLGDEQDEEPPTALVALLGLFFFAIFIPNLAVQVRRFHDQNRSGWFVLLNLIPYLGSFVVLVFMLLPGTTGPNRFGSDPKQL